MEKRNKSYNLIAGVFTLVVIILIVAVIGYIVSKPKPLIIQGEVEATEYRVSGKVPGRIEELLYKEGDKIQKGDTVVLIDSPEVRAKLAQAKAARSMALAQKEKSLNGARKEQITGAYELYQQAKVKEDIMKKSFERLKRLYTKKVISAQKFDEASAKYNAAVAQRKAAKSQYDMALNGARKEDKATAEALVNKANAAIMEVESYLAELHLTSPASGIISAVFPKTGELVGTGSPIMTITDLSDIWFTFNIREDYLNGLKLNSEVSLKIPALNKTVKAKVSYIAVRESYATWRATKETEMYDAKTFEVRAVPVEEIEGIYPGMSVILNSK